MHLFVSCSSLTFPLYIQKYLPRYLSLSLSKLSSRSSSLALFQAVNHLCFSAQSHRFISYLHLRLHLPLVSCFSASFFNQLTEPLQYNVDPYYWSSHTHTRRHARTHTRTHAHTYKQAPLSSLHYFPDILNLSIPPHLSPEVTSVRTQSSSAPPHKMRVSLSDIRKCVCVWEWGGIGGSGVTEDILIRDGRVTWEWTELKPNQSKKDFRN